MTMRTRSHQEGLSLTDKVFNYYATAMRQLTDHFSLGLQYVHTDDNSNVAAFQYKRNIYGLVLTGQF